MSFSTYCFREVSNGRYDTSNPSSLQFCRVFSSKVGSSAVTTSFGWAILDEFQENFINAKVNARCYICGEVKIHWWGYPDATNGLDVIPQKGRFPYFEPLVQAELLRIQGSETPRLQDITKISVSKDLLNTKTQGPVDLTPFRMADKEQQPQVSEQDAQNAKDPNHPAHPEHPHVNTTSVFLSPKLCMLTTISTVNGSRMRARNSATLQSLELEQQPVRTRSRVHWDSEKGMTMWVRKRSNRVP